MKKSKIIFLCDPLGNFLELHLCEPLVFNNFDQSLLNIHVPSVTANFIKGKKCIAIIKLVSAGKIKSIQKGKNIEIHDAFNLKIPLYIYHLVYSVFHKFWLRINVYSVHSACVSKNGFITLLLGHSGFGKTTVSLNLLKKYGFRLVFSDRVLLKIKKDSILVPFGGTKLITYKKTNKKIPLNLVKSNKEYVDRKIAKLLPNYTLKEIPSSVDAIIFIRLSNTENKIEIVEPFEALVTLYKFFLDILGSDALILNGQAIYEGIDLKLKSKIDLLRKLKKVIARTPIVSTMGSLEKMNGRINNWVDKKSNE